MSSVSLAISPCPNDTLMFHHLLHTKKHGFNFELSFADIEELNTGLLNKKWDMAKMSIAAYPLFIQEYELLNVGMAMGFGNGPLLIASDSSVNPNNFTGEILIPGKNTTAHALLRRYFPNLTNTKETLFSDIPKAVANGVADLGLIIHESRFTYKNLGLHQLADLGETWEKDLNLPLPLGGIVIRRSLPLDTKNALANALQKSVQTGLNDIDKAMRFILENSSEKNINVVQQHIDLYVNAFSVDAGELGRKAVLTLLSALTENDSLTLQKIFHSWKK